MTIINKITPNLIQKTVNVKVRNDILKHCKVSDSFERSDSVSFQGRLSSTRKIKHFFLSENTIFKKKLSKTINRKLTDGTNLTTRYLFGKKHEEYLYSKTAEGTTYIMKEFDRAGDIQLSMLEKRDLNNNLLLEEINVKNGQSQKRTFSNGKIFQEFSINPDNSTVEINYQNGIPQKYLFNSLDLKVEKFFDQKRNAREIYLTKKDSTEYIKMDSAGNKIERTLEESLQDGTKTKLTYSAEHNFTKPEKIEAKYPNGTRSTLYYKNGILDEVRGTELNDDGEILNIYRKFNQNEVAIYKEVSFPSEKKFILQMTPDGKKVEYESYIFKNIDGTVTREDIIYNEQNKKAFANIYEDQELKYIYKYDDQEKVYEICDADGYVLPQTNIQVFRDDTLLKNPEYISNPRFDTLDEIIPELKYFNSVHSN